MTSMLLLDSPNTAAKLAIIKQLLTQRMSKPEIQREQEVEANLIPPLDPSLLQLSDTEAEFLHAAISSDEQELHRRILDVQKEYDALRRASSAVANLHYAYVSQGLVSVLLERMSRDACLKYYSVMHTLIPVSGCFTLSRR